MQGETIPSITAYERVRRGDSRVEIPPGQETRSHKETLRDLKQQLKHYRVSAAPRGQEV